MSLTPAHAPGNWNQREWVTAFREKVFAMLHIEIDFFDWSYEAEDQREAEDELTRSMIQGLLLNLIKPDFDYTTMGGEGYLRFIDDDERRLAVDDLIWLCRAIADSLSDEEWLERT